MKIKSILLTAVVASFTTFGAEYVTTNLNDRFHT